MNIKTIEDIAKAAYKKSKDADSQLAQLANPPMCKITHNINQSMTAGNNYPLAFNTEEFDTDNMHDNTTNNGRITIKTAGKYLCLVQVEFASSAAGKRGCYIKKNGTDYLARFIVPAVDAPSRISVVTIDDFAVNDYITAEIFQDSGGALDVIGNTTYSPIFSAIKVG